MSLLPQKQLCNPWKDEEEKCLCSCAHVIVIGIFVAALKISQDLSSTSDLED